jgi:HK97 gp10 family phage protein
VIIISKCTYELPEEFLLRISALNEKTDEIVPKVLAAGGAVVVTRVKSNLQAVVGTNTKYESRSTGKLVASLGVSPAKLDRDGNFDVHVGFADPRDGKLTNAMLGNVIEFGKSGQPPRPFMKPAKSQSKAGAIAAMESALNDELERL